MKLKKDKHQGQHGSDCPECGKVERALKRSAISYFSDLFIVSMVLLWIFDNVFQSAVASAVTISSIILSFKTGVAMYDTSMWSSIGSNVAIPLSCGGAIWMIKNSVQHAIAYSKGKVAKEDFPKVAVDNFEIENPETEVQTSSNEIVAEDNIQEEIVDEFTASEELSETTISNVYSQDEDCR